MPAFGKKQKEESLNDKMVRLFKEGKSVHDISKELDVKPDVITNVIRRRCGEDSIPETVIRSKNAVPHSEAPAPKAESAAPAPAPIPSEPENATEDNSSDGMSKLEKLIMEREKKKQEQETVAQEEAAAEEPEEATMDAVSMDGISLDDLGTADPSIPEPVYDENTQVDVPEPEMDGISAEDIPDLSANDTIAEQPITKFESGIEEQPAEADPVTDGDGIYADEPAAEPEVSEPPAPAHVPMHDVHASGSAFDKMKAFALAQVESNNAKIAELEQKLGLVEGDYQSQLDEAEKAVEESKVKYEEVITRSEKIDEERAQVQTEHRTAIARAEEEYRRKLAEVDEEYNNATAHANKILAEKESEINEKADAVSEEKETAKNDFLSNQSKVNEIKDKITAEVDTVKAEIESIREENKGYESFM